MSGSRITSDVSVLAGAPGKHLLRLSRDPRLRLHQPEDAADVTPDIVLLPFSLTTKALELAETLPARVWERPAAGAGSVVFDASLEGVRHDPARSERLHGFLEGRGIPLECGVYVTQDRGYAADYAGYCRERGLGRTMRVLNYDYWIRRVLGEYDQVGPAELEARLEAFRARSRRRERRFVSLNLTARPTKVLFLLALLRDGLWDDGFISFGGFEQILRTKNHSVESFVKTLFSLPELRPLSEQLWRGIPALAEKGRIILRGAATEGGQDERLFADDALPEYGRSWFSVITETEMLGRPCRITEKPLKALLNLHPFLVLGNPGALAMIRGLGFETFPELFDERYDEEPDPLRRFGMVYAEVRRLCAMDEAGLDRLEAGVAEKLEHNARWGLTRLPHIQRDETDRAFLDLLLLR